MSFFICHVNSDLEIYKSTTGGRPVSISVMCASVYATSQLLSHARPPLVKMPTDPPSSTCTSSVGMTFRSDSIGPRPLFTGSTRQRCVCDNYVTLFASIYVEHSGRWSRFKFVYAYTGVDYAWAQSDRLPNSRVKSRILDIRADYGTKVSIVSCLRFQ